MLRRSFFVSFAVISVVLIAAIKPPTVDEVARLRNRYLWGSIYLTYNSLIELDWILNRQTGSGQGSLGDPRACELLQNILAKTTVGHPTDSIAFLQLDLSANPVRAGYSLSNAVQGTVVPLTWTPEDVRRVAVFVDKFLNSKMAAIELSNQLRNKRRDLRSAWQQLAKISNDPLVGNHTKWDVDLAFREFVISEPAALHKVRETDAQLAKSIEEFRAKVDAQLANQNVQPRINRDENRHWKPESGLPPTSTYAIETATSATTGADTGWSATMTSGTTMTTTTGTTMTETISTTMT
jgi:hypothetical protein